MPLEAEVGVEMVTEGGRGFMAAGRKSEVDAARQEKKWIDCVQSDVRGFGITGD